MQELAAKEDLKEILLDELGKGEMTFRDLLKKIPDAAPLSVKLALDTLEKEAKVTKFVRNDRYLFGLTAGQAPKGH